MLPYAHASRFMTLPTALKTINVLGTGRVGQTLARLLNASWTCEVQDLMAASETTVRAAADFIGAGRPVLNLRELRPADIWLLAVPDTRIAQVATELADALAGNETFSSSHAVAFHCSGFQPASVMAPLRALGWQLASVHPVLTFASPQAAVSQFAGTPCGFEGDLAAVQALEPVFLAIGAQVFRVATERKALYHAASVFSSNFTVVLQAIAREAWASAGVTDGMAAKLHQGLLRATVNNVLAFGAHRAITGPAARGDLDVVRAQGAAVAAWHERAGLLYRELSALASALAQTGSTLPPPAPPPQQ